MTDLLDDAGPWRAWLLPRDDNTYNDLVWVDSIATGDTVRLVIDGDYTGQERLSYARTLVSRLNARH